MIQVRARGATVELYERHGDPSGNNDVQHETIAQLNIDEALSLMVRINGALPEANKAARAANAAALEKARLAVADAQARLLEAQRRQQQLEGAQ